MKIVLVLLPVLALESLLPANSAAGVRVHVDEAGHDEHRVAVPRVA